MDDNEIHLRRVLRVYRNALVGLIRSRLTAKYGSGAEAELAALYGKKDPTTGQPQWERMKENAKIARSQPEISTTVADCYELLGVSDFYGVIDHFHAELIPRTSNDTETHIKERRKGILRCTQQVKVFRDPNAHDVTEAIDDDSLSLCIENCIAITRALDLTSATSAIRELKRSLVAARQYRSALLLAVGTPSPLVQVVQYELRQRGVAVETLSVNDWTITAAAQERIAAFENVLVIVGAATRVHELPQADLNRLEAILRACLASSIDPVVFLGHRLDASLLQATLPASLQPVFGANSPVMLMEEYVFAAVSHAVPLLKPSRLAVQGVNAPPSVPAARAVHNEALAKELFVALEQLDLKEARLISPFLTNASPSPFGSGQLARLLIDARGRGCNVSILTRPPLSNDRNDRENEKFIEVMMREGINVFVNELLHAKVYLFRRAGDRYTWMVGSHNLTNLGLAKHLETSMVGHRSLEFREAATTFDRLRKHPQTVPLELWRARKIRTRSSSRFTREASRHDN